MAPIIDFPILDLYCVRSMSDLTLLGGAGQCSDSRQSDHLLYAVVEQLMTFFQRAGERGVLTTLEVANSVHDLSSALAKTTARRRGRGSA
jgi:hypothetical protein